MQLNAQQVRFYLAGGFGGEQLELGGSSRCCIALANPSPFADPLNPRNTGAVQEGCRRREAVQELPGEFVCGGERGDTLSGSLCCACSSRVFCCPHPRAYGRRSLGRQPRVLRSWHRALCDAPSTGIGVSSSCRHDADRGRVRAVDGPPPPPTHTQRSAATICSPMPLPFPRCQPNPTQRPPRPHPHSHPPLRSSAPRTPRRSSLTPTAAAASRPASTRWPTRCA